MQSAFGKAPMPRNGDDDFPKQVKNTLKESVEVVKKDVQSPAGNASEEGSAEPRQSPEAGEHPASPRPRR